MTFDLVKLKISIMHMQRVHIKLHSVHVHRAHSCRILAYMCLHQFIFFSVWLFWLWLAWQRDSREIEIFLHLRLHSTQSRSTHNSLFYMYNRERERDMEVCNVSICKCASSSPNTFSRVPCVSIKSFEYFMFPVYRWGLYLVSKKKKKKLPTLKNYHGSENPFFSLLPKVKGKKYTLNLNTLSTWYNTSSPWRFLPSSFFF